MKNKKARKDSYLNLLEFFYCNCTIVDHLEGWHILFVVTSTRGQIATICNYHGNFLHDCK